MANTPPVAPRAGPSSERERIRDFWLGLEEGDRRALVKVEKEAVLRKMKEQQRSGCSCAVCGRKRAAIEEELEVLYEAYYDELESYALHQARSLDSHGAIPPPPGPGPFPGSVDASPTPAPLPIAAKKAPIKTTRDHKNVRPAAKKKAPLNPPPNPANPPPPGHNHHDGPAHGEPGHTHSSSCPHHPHNHNGPPTAQAKAKGAQIEEYDDEGVDSEGEEGSEGGDYYEDEQEEESVTGDQSFGFDWIE